MNTKNCSPFIISNNFGNIPTGNGVLLYATAKLLSLKHNIPLLFQPFMHSNLFVFSKVEKTAKENGLSEYSIHDNFIKIKTEEDIKKGQNKEAFFYTDLFTIIDSINKEDIKQLKELIQLNEVPIMTPIPPQSISIALHIRMGNGSDEPYKVTLSSNQLFSTDKRNIQYITNWDYFCLDWYSYRRINNKFINDHNIQPSYGLTTEKPSKKSSLISLPRKKEGFDDGLKFPPLQYYIDQLEKLSKEFKNKKIFVQIITDAINQNELLETFKEYFRNLNITFYYDNNKHLSYDERIARDLYALSRTDILIRGESSFCRTAEFMGNHKIIIFPLECVWEENKLIMSKIIIKRLRL